MHITVNSHLNMEIVVPVDKVILTKKTTRDSMGLTIIQYRIHYEGIEIIISQDEYERVKGLIQRINVYEVDRFNAIQKAIGRGEVEQIDRSEISALMGITLNDD